MERCKITQHTNNTIRVTAPYGYHIELLDGTYLGKVIYDGIGTRLDDKYKLVLDNNYLTSAINQ